MLDADLMDAIARRSPIWGAGAQDWWDFTRSGRAKRGVGAMPAETRASDGWVENEAGLLVKRSANTRSMAGKGLLTFPTRTNLLLRSQELNNASWSGSAGSPTIAADNVASPDGAVTAERWARTTTAASYTGQNVAKAASAVQYVLSAFVKADTARYAAIRMQGTYPNRVDAVFDLQSGAVSSVTASGTFSGATASITPLANGWFLITVSSTSDTATTVGSYVSFNANATRIDTIDSSASSSGWVWQMQLEAAAFASPPILTSGSAATANGPQQVIDIGSRAALGVGGVIQVDLRDVTATSKAVFMLNDGTSNNYVVLYANRGSSTASLSVVNGGVVQAQIDLPTAPATGLATYAFAVGANYAMARLVGASAPTADTVVTFPATLSKFALGGSGFDAGSNNYQFAKRLGLWYGPMSAHFFDNVLWPKAQLLAQQVA